MDQRSNIFDEAARKGSRPAKPSSAKPSSAPMASDPFGLDNKKTENIELDQFNPATMTLSDVEKMVAKVQQLHDEIDRKLDDIYQKSGWSPSQIKNYLDNPNNFSPEEWERVQKERETFLNSFKTEEELEAGPAKANSQQDLPKAAKERRGKMIGARRNWIPMR